MNKVILPKLAKDIKQGTQQTLKVNSIQVEKKKGLKVFNHVTNQYQYI
jgi:hypothetical protein